MSREDARSARKLCDRLFQQAGAQRLLIAALTAMAEKRAPEATLHEMAQVLGEHGSEADMSQELDVLVEQGVVRVRGDRLAFQSDYVFAELAARCGTAGPQERQSAVFFWLITSDPRDRRMSRAFGRFIVLAQTAVAIDGVWLAALEEAIRLGAAHAVERAANLVGKLASAQAQAFDYIEQLASDPLARRRWFACLCVAHMTRRHEDAVRLLVQLMKDPVWHVWWAASLSMGKKAVKSMAARWALQMLSQSPAKHLRTRASRGPPGAGPSIGRVPPNTCARARAEAWRCWKLGAGPDTAFLDAL